MATNNMLPSTERSVNTIARRVDDLAPDAAKALRLYARGEVDESEVAGAVFAIYQRLYVIDMADPIIDATDFVLDYCAEVVSKWTADFKQCAEDDGLAGDALQDAQNTLAEGGKPDLDYAYQKLRQVYQRLRRIYDSFSHLDRKPIVEAKVAFESYEKKQAIKSLETACAGLLEARDRLRTDAVLNPAFTRLKGFEDPEQYYLAAVNKRRLEVAGFRPALYAQRNFLSGYRPPRQWRDANQALVNLNAIVERAEGGFEPDLDDQEVKRFLLGPGALFGGEEGGLLGDLPPEFKRSSAYRALRNAWLRLQHEIEGFFEFTKNPPGSPVSFAGLGESLRDLYESMRRWRTRFERDAPALPVADTAIGQAVERIRLDTEDRVKALEYKVRTDWDSLEQRIAALEGAKK